MITRWDHASAFVELQTEAAKQWVCLHSPDPTDSEIVGCSPQLTAGSTLLACNVEVVVPRFVAYFFYLVFFSAAVSYVSCVPYNVSCVCVCVCVSCSTLKLSTVMRKLFVQPTEPNPTRPEQVMFRNLIPTRSLWDTHARVDFERRALVGGCGAELSQ